MSPGRLAGAFLLVWLPYIASTFLAERMGEGGLPSQLLMLLAFVMIWPAARLAGSRFGLGVSRRTLAWGLGCFLLGLFAAAIRWQLSLVDGAISAGGGEPWPTISGALGAAAIAFFPSLAEDVLTRGFPIFAWKRRSLTAVILLSAALYTVNHLWRFDWGWTEQARLFAMGLAYAAAAVATGSLWAAVGLHLAGNVAPALLAPLAGGEVVDVDRDRLAAVVFNLLLALGFMLVAIRRERGNSPGKFNTGYVKADGPCD